MKERPILMTPENAQKCHVGTKTQTRRTNGLKKVNGSGPWDYPQMQSSGIAIFLDSTQANPYNNALEVTCPYGVVGDRLWVREAFCLCGVEGSKKPLYRGQCEEYPSLKPIWKPSLHMPRWACRTVLEMTEVRVERLQEITVTDAIAEGIPCPNRTGDKLMMVDDGFDVLWSFRALWESIHGAGSWAQNPWVWVIAFKKVGDP